EPQANLHHTFLDVVPQVIATLNLADADQLKLGYNYRIQRPSITQLNPYRQQVSPLQVKYGNENLSNEKVHAFDATYSHYTQKFSLMLSASYLFSNNKVEGFLFSQPDSKGNPILHQTYTDKGKMRTIGFNLFTQYVPASWVRLYIQSNLNYITLDASAIKLNGKDNYGNTIMKGFGGNTFTGASFTLPKDWSIGVNAGVFIQPPRININSFWGTWHGVNLSKSFLKQQLTVSAWLNNPLNPWYNFKIGTSSPSFSGETHVRNYGLSTGISISYSFGNLKSVIRKVSRSIENNDLMKSDKGNGNQTPGGGSK
ncbi:MAG: TonB-dependent receptor, partial [Bacteroidales bacterium]|nr:TonB-dependent receptor [Bacteroidales bacterium]MDY3102228.1 TonB-dependent receptor [Porphyromonas sp.]